MNSRWTLYFFPDGGSALLTFSVFVDVKAESDPKSVCFINICSYLISATRVGPLGNCVCL